VTKDVRKSTLRCTCMVLCILCLPFGTTSGQARISYAIQADYEASQRTLRGTLRATVPRSILDTAVLLRTGRSTVVTTVRMGGREVPFRNGADSVSRWYLIRLDGRSGVVLDLAFRTIVDSSTQGLGYGLFNAGSIDSRWYPSVHVESVAQEYADFDVSITYPATYEMLSGGVRDTATLGVKRRAHHVLPDVEGMPLAIGRGFRVTTATREGVQINVFDRVSPDSAIGDLVIPTAAAIAWYTRNLGFFPYGAVGILPGFATASGGNAMPGMFMIHRVYRGPEFLIEMAAHELGHFYWGHGVLGEGGPGDYSWLMLGNGIWTDHLYMAERKGIPFNHYWYVPDLFQNPERVLIAQAASHEQRLGLGPAERSRITTDYGGFISHAKAAVGIQLLAQRLGVNRFLELQQALLRKYWHQPLSPEVFALELEQAGLPDAQQWVALWQRGDARIAYQVESVRSIIETPFTYQIRVGRVGTISYPFDVVVRGANGDSVAVRVQGRGMDTVNVSLKSTIAKIELDPAGDVLMWGSDNWRVRGAAVRAMLASGAGSAAIHAALGHIRTFPNDSLTRSALVVRLTSTGMHGEALSVAGAPEGFLHCRSRATCRALLAVVRSRWAMGDHAGSRQLLDHVRAEALVHGALGDLRLTARMMQ